MKYYETHYEDYINSIERYNLHPELNKLYNKLPNKLNQLQNLIIYGPSGIGKYSQVLYLLKKYSPSELKYDKKITVNTDKQQYIYRISDIHYEVDMSLLGCNSKLLWHEIFFQIVDIVSVKSEKIGIIICKNFHLIHTELLEIFYSYIQQYNNSQSNIKINFIIISEHISFLPSQIINSCQIINIKRPSKERYFQMLTFSKICNIKSSETNEHKTFYKTITEYKTNMVDTMKSKKILDNINTEGIINTKELFSFSTIDKIENVPEDIFNIICDKIIEELLKTTKLSFTEFRDVIYDILTYNLDVTECIWYIIKYLIINNNLKNNKDISDVLKKTHLFLKYYNNNYRPIYHLESMFFYIINKIHNYK
jgi:hypothetical protein